MKEKILTFVIGLLTGAIISTGILLIINQNNTANNPDRMMIGGPRQQQMGDFAPEEMPAGEKTQGMRGERQKGDKKNTSDTNNTETTQDSSPNTEIDNAQNS